MKIIYFHSFFGQADDDQPDSEHQRKYIYDFILCTWCLCLHTETGAAISYQLRDMQLKWMTEFDIGIFSLNFSFKSAARKTRWSHPILLAYQETADNFPRINLKCKHETNHHLEGHLGNSLPGVGNWWHKIAPE